MSPFTGSATGPGGGRHCALGPSWTLHAAAEQACTGPGAPWPLPYRAGSRKPPVGRADYKTVRQFRQQGGGTSRR